MIGLLRSFYRSFFVSHIFFLCGLDEREVGGVGRLDDFVSVSGRHAFGDGRVYTFQIRITHGLSLSHRLIWSRVFWFLFDIFNLELINKFFFGFSIIFLFCLVYCYEFNYPKMNLVYSDWLKDLSHVCTDSHLVFHLEEFMISRVGAIRLLRGTIFIPLF